MLPPDLNTMTLGRLTKPFDHSEWIVELKYDGFRALAAVEHGTCALLSRNGHAFASFRDLASYIGSGLPTHTAVLDGEIVCLDADGHPQFNDLLFRRGEPRFAAFDLLYCDGHDLRRERLIDRKQELKRIVGTDRGPIFYVDHVEGCGTKLFGRICELDLEGIVAKHGGAPYAADPERTTWFKVLNRNYSQMVGRAELFERDRHREPVPGWHSCALACADAE